MRDTKNSNMFGILIVVLALIEGVIFVLSWNFLLSVYGGKSLNDGERLVLDKLLLAFFSILAAAGTIIFVEPLKRRFDRYERERDLLWETIPDINGKYAIMYSGFISLINKAKGEGRIKILDGGISKIEFKKEDGDSFWKQVVDSNRAAIEYLSILDKHEIKFPKGTYNEFCFHGQTILTLVDEISFNVFPFDFIEVEAFIMYLNERNTDISKTMQREDDLIPPTWFKNNTRITWHYRRSAIEEVENSLRRWLNDKELNKVYLEFANKYSKVEPDEIIYQGEK